MKIKKEIIANNVILRLINVDDKEAYYNAGFKTMDEQSRYFTQTKHVYSQHQIYEYVDRIVEDETRYDFLIIDLNHQICGESVLNEIDWDKRSANYRIALFDHENFGKGVGSASVKLTVQFGFKELGLDRVELEVFDFNERAIKSYLKAGFQVESIENEVQLLDGTSGKIIKMSITKNSL
ncbi:MAG: GNAT family N-acetyltransferase [Erysipelotrichaceae bacterium]|nr:GNAT family N-acetyltransferase [Erysipelotrichaceae bacterium]